MAAQLLQLPSLNCKFFGALTYAVVIHKLVPNSPPEHIQQIIVDLQGALSALHFSKDAQRYQLITQKLLSNLALVFVKFHSLFDEPTQLLYPIFADQGHEKQQHQIALALRFLSILVEDISKNEIIDTKVHVVVHEHIYPHLLRTIAFLQQLSLAKNLLPQLETSSLDCLNSWVTYMSIAETASEVRYNETNDLTEYLFQHLKPLAAQSPNEMELASKALLVFAEIIEVNPRMLNFEAKNRLSGNLLKEGSLGYDLMLLIISGDGKDDFEDAINNFMNALVAYLQMDILKLSKSILTNETMHIIKVVASLTNAAGYPIHNETVSDLLLSFWSELANTYIDDVDTFEAMFEKDPDQKRSFEEEKIRIFNEVCGIYWKKIHLPPLHILTSVRSEFLYYRSNVADFFLVTYSLISLPFYNSLTSNLVESLANIKTEPGLIVNIESILYLLYKITDDSTFYESQASALLPFVEKVLHAGLVPVMSDYPNYGDMEVYFQSTLIHYLSSIQFFLKIPENKTFLTLIFDFLFAVLINSSSSSSVSLITSKTILKVCQECRSNLVEFLPTIEQILVTILENHEFDSLVRQRMFHSYTSIAQCIKDPVQSSEILSRMLTAIYNQSLKVMTALPESVSEDQEDYLISLFSCVVEIGKGCQAPEEVEELYTDEEQQTINNHWSEDPQNVKGLITRIVEQFSLQYKPLAQNSSITEKSCLILKSGLGEEVNGPFCFALNDIFGYLVVKLKATSNPNSIPYIYSLVETIVIINFKDLDAALLEQLLLQIFTEKVSFLRTDPYMIKAAIDVFATILEKSPSLIIHSPSVFNDVIFDFAMSALRAHESFIIKSALRFWVSFVLLRKGNQEDHDRVSNFISSEVYGKTLALNLLQSFIDTSRSNLELYYPIFRQLLGKYQLFFKRWLQQILIDERNFSTKNEKIDTAYLNSFIEQLMVTRGQRSAQDVLKKFWLSINGLIEFSNQKY